MITIASALQRIRLLAGDMQKTKYSDYEIRAALDAGVDMLRRSQSISTPASICSAIC